MLSRLSIGRDMLAIYTLLIYLPTIISANLLVAQFQFFPALHFHLYVDAATEHRIFSKRSSFSNPAPPVYFRVREMQSRPLQLPATVAYPSVETAARETCTAQPMAAKFSSERIS